jgi:molybdopterin converting factor small subunit
MHTKILIPTALQVYTGDREAIEAHGATVGEVLADLAERFAALRRHLYADDGRLRSFVNVYVNDEDVRYLQHESTPLHAGDVVSIVPSIAGGIA